MHLVTFERAAKSEGTGGEHASRLGDALLGFEALDFTRQGRRRLGALIPPGPHAGDVVDLNRALAVKLATEDVGAPEAEAESLVPSDMITLLQHGQEALDIAASAMNWVLGTLERFDGPDLQRGGVVLPRSHVRLCAPIPRPPKIVAVMRNYAAHARERGAEVPEEPVLFIAASSSVIGPDDDIVLPAVSRQVDYEGELAVVIGRAASNVAEEDALEHVAGYTVANDVTARDFQRARGQLVIGKSCDTFTPMGPALVTHEEIDDPGKLDLQTTVSGEVRQSATTAEMCFTVAQLIAFASQLMTLEPGDVLLTGTPGGVGAAMDPPRFLAEGDVVDVEIERLGRLRNHVTGQVAD